MYIRAEMLLQFELCMAAIEEALVPIYCPHSSAGCWLSSNGFVGICGFSIERLRALLPKLWPTHGRKVNRTTPGYDRFSSWIPRFPGSRWGGKWVRKFWFFSESLVIQGRTQLLSRWELMAVITQCIFHVYLPLFGVKLRIWSHSLTVIPPSQMRN